jgi:hypothetical protein
LKPPCLLGERSKLNEQGGAAYDFNNARAYRGSMTGGGRGVAKGRHQKKFQIFQFNILRGVLTAAFFFL